MALAVKAAEIRSRVAFDELDGLVITIPALKNWLLVLALGIYLCCWAIGEVIGLGILSARFLGLANRPGFGKDAEMPILLVFIVCWTVGGLALLDALVWHLKGREQICIDGQSIVISRLDALFWRPARAFAFSNVSNLRFAPLAVVAFPRSFSDSVETTAAHMQMMTVMGTGGGSVAFECGGKTHRFGIQLSESESRRLIKTVKDRYKIQEDKDEPLPVERL